MRVHDVVHYIYNNYSGKYRLTFNVQSEGSNYIFTEEFEQDRMGVDKYLHKDGTDIIDKYGMYEVLSYKKREHIFPDYIITLKNIDMFFKDFLKLYAEHVKNTCKFITVVVEDSKVKSEYFFKYKGNHSFNFINKDGEYLEDKYSDYIFNFDDLFIDSNFQMLVIKLKEPGCL